jgi:hypothetical protein
VITRKDAAQCLLLLCGSEVSGAQRAKLESRGLVTRGSLNKHGFVAAYEELANIQFGGTSLNRNKIASAAKAEAEEWKKVQP